MIYLIVRKYKSQYSENYRIEKWAKTIKEANKFLSAITLLEDDDENVMHFIVQAEENPALILTNEVA
jgi:hypothetical protein|tara:strand:+ start:254 stop:454 length:201 start_codon:yes stop_codon:yes gene_type:complete